MKLNYFLRFSSSPERHFDDVSSISGVSQMGFVRHGIQGTPIYGMEERGLSADDIRALLGRLGAESVLDGSTFAAFIEFY